NDLLGTPPNSQILVSLNGLEFPQTALSNSTTKDMIIQNVGDVDLTITSLQLSGIDNNHFHFNAPAVPFNILPNDTIDVSVNFEPLSVGNKTVDFIINNTSSNNNSVVLTFTGEAVETAETDYDTNISAEYNFGDVYIYGGAVLVTLTVSNSSSAPYTVAGLSITGMNADLFSIIQQPVLPKLFNPGDSDIVVLSFDPDTVGEKTAVIEASFQNNTILDTANLLGNGVITIDNPNALKLTNYEYWFNDDYFGKQTTSLSASNSFESLDFDAVTTGLTNGLNILHFRVRDEENHWSSVLSEFVYVQNTSNSGTNNVVDYEYWYDNDYAGRIVGNGSGTNPLLLGLNDNVGSLGTGLHQFHIRFKDEKGVWSSVVSEFIYNDKPIGLGSNKIAAYRLWFNDDFAGRISGAFTPEETIVFSEDVDISGLEVNSINHIHFQFKDIYGNWSSVLTEEFLYEALVLSSTVFLQGSLINPIVGEEDLMRDDLRVAELLPTTSPYTDGLLCDNSVFSATGDDAIVDWVWLELRDSSDRSIVVEGRSALLQRDGDIVNIDGVSAVNFHASADDYYLLVQHRNHLSILSALPVSMSTETAIDLSSDPLLVFGGNNAVINIGGVFAMISGDAQPNGQIQNSDVIEVIDQLGTAGYSNLDTDMNGQVQNTDINVSIRTNLGRGIQY
ncbi:MAG: choice-of-anchor D domain-containing protein, partial [Altibacter sp.]|uniref:choice-of-anchor D domain-containing protein n=1 Tax=Altibacter sp. TaxID=2024823 RepID=UPI001DA29DE3